MVDEITKKKRGPKKGSGGRPPYKRDEGKAQLVSLFIGTGCKLEAIAYSFGISDETLIKYYGPEIAKGRELNELFWVGSLAAAARRGSVEAIKFALARRFGWVEKTHLVVEDNGEDGIIFDVTKPAVSD